jgi:excinuclease UvrABC nuclease subunit
MIPFPKSGVRLDAPAEQGVYVIRGGNGSVLHVGRTTRAKNGLRQRLANHLQSRSSFAIVYLGGNGSRLRRGYTYQYLVVPNPRTRVLLEYAATVRFCPRHLGDGARMGPA